MNRLFVAPQELISRHTKQLAVMQFVRRPASITKLLVNGTLFVVIALLALLAESYFHAGNEYVLPRLYICLAAASYVIVARLFVAYRRQRIAAWMLIGFYTALATLILLQWSINAQIGILTLGFIIILAGVMLGARYIMPVSMAAVALLVILQALNTIGWIDPDRSGLGRASTFVDVLSYAIIFTVFALVSWIAGRQTEQTLAKALAAEKALEAEKQLLTVRLDEQTQRLREVQLAEMRQLYRFAELGQLSVVILHELANYLGALTLDINDIDQRHHESGAVMRAKETISYLDTIVVQARRQLRESNQSKVFNALPVIEEAIKGLVARAHKADVVLVFTGPAPRKAFLVLGDPLRLSQVMTIILANAIEAYARKRSGTREVLVSVAIEAGGASITITDHGSGISPEARGRLFVPFATTKKSGMGIGLFIAKEIIDTHFKGSIRLDPATDCTKFIITLPEYVKK